MSQPYKKIIFDVGHPSEVHHYRCVYQNLKTKGWSSLFVAKDKDVIVALLRTYHLPFVVMAKNRGGLFWKLLQLPLDLIRFSIILIRYKPDLVVSAVSVHSSWISALLRVPHIAFIDTEPRKIVDFFTLPFIHAQVTSKSYYRQLGKRQVRYSGTHELAYLHPRRFSPDASVRKELGLKEREPYVIMRFVAWKAFHDWGLTRMNNTDRLMLFNEILKKRRVFITAEGELPRELEQFKFPLQPHRIFDALAFADLYVGEGITMAAEAVTLGTAAVLINSMQMGYCLEAQQHGMMFRFDELSDSALNKISEILSLTDIRRSFADKHRCLLANKIDVTEFMTWFIQTFPKSFEQMRAYTDIDLKFL